MEGYLGSAGLRVVQQAEFGGPSKRCFPMNPSFPYGLKNE